MNDTLQIPLQITFRNMHSSDALEAHIRDKVAKLGGFHSRIVSCRVTVEELAGHQHKGRQFRIGVQVRTPGHPELVVNHDHDEDPYVALREAFDAMVRKIEVAPR